jgi:hypothetical protein
LRMGAPGWLLLVRPASFCLFYACTGAIASLTGGGLEAAGRVPVVILMPTSFSSAETCVRKPQFVR